MNKKLFVIVSLFVVMLCLPTAKAGEYLQKIDNIFRESDTVLSVDMEHMYNTTAFYDFSPNNNYGVDYNTIEATGVYGLCRRFDALDNKNITIAHDETLSFSGIYAEFTIMFWFKPSTIILYGDILSKRVNSSSYNYGILQYLDEIRFYWGRDIDYRTTTDINFVADTWYHITIIFNDNTNIISVYSNATLKTLNDNNTYNIHSITNTEPLILGVFNNSTNYLNGYLDEVRIFDYALTQSEIQDYMNTVIESSLTIQGLVNDDVVQMWYNTTHLWEQQTSVNETELMFNVFDFGNKETPYQSIVKIYREDIQYESYMIVFDWGDIYTFLVSSAYEDLFIQLFYGEGAWLGLLVLILGSLFCLKLYKYSAIIFSAFFILLGLQYYQAFNTGLDDLLWFWVFCWVMPIFLILAMFKLKR